MLFERKILIQKFHNTFICRLFQVSLSIDPLLVIPCPLFLFSFSLSGVPFPLFLICCYFSFVPIILFLFPSSLYIVCSLLFFVCYSLCTGRFYNKLILMQNKLENFWDKQPVVFLVLCHCFVQEQKDFGLKYIFFSKYFFRSKSRHIYCFELIKT